MKTVLIVDDHSAIRMAVKILLLAEGFHICGEVDNGIDALQIVKASTPNIVVLDIGIPKLDGIDVINRIKKSNSHSLLSYLHKMAITLCLAVFRLGLMDLYPRWMT
ncbi:response regulator transcription factor [Aeromonas salmonicida]|uniref:response regulator transcription factor n=1 Tax=Aeromonas salmonicida TaxID=645 RepID=UPI003670602A